MTTLAEAASASGVCRTLLPSTGTIAPSASHSYSKTVTDGAVKKRRSSTGSWLVAGLVLVAAIVVGVVVWRRAAHPRAVPALATSNTPAASSAAATQPSIRHPISQAGAPAPATSASLPALDASDSLVANALASLAGSSDLGALLFPEQIIPHIVATVDALPRESVGTRVLPVRTPAGSFETEQMDGHAVIAAANAARYAPYMRVLEDVDPKALVAWYVRNYPLFQQAYRELGYPNGYFNDRLIAAIDDMLAAPTPSGPIALVQPKVFYRYADPGLQSLSAGQKLLIRTGPANEATIKARLRAFRAALTGAQLPAAATSR